VIALLYLVFFVPSVNEEHLMDWFFCVSGQFHSTAGQVWLKFLMNFMPFECNLKWYLPSGWDRDPLVGQNTKSDGSEVHGGLRQVQWIGCKEQTPIVGRAFLVGWSPQERQGGYYRWSLMGRV
jgi:hypothetical protein